MIKGILGRKIGMSQVFSDSGDPIVVTVVEVEENVVLQKKTLEIDRYNAIQIGFSDKKNPNKSEVGRSQKANTNPKRYVKEIRGASLEVGKRIRADIFQEGDIVDVTGISKGKGFQGVIKRHGLSGGPASHGSRFHRAPGSIGVIAKNDGMKVFKGKKMPGRMGGKQTTIQNLTIIKVDSERNLLLIKGNIPGAKKSFVIIETAIKKLNEKWW